MSAMVPSPCPCRIPLSALVAAMLALAAARPARAEPAAAPPVALAAPPAEFGDEARVLFRLVTCRGDAPLPPRFDAGVLAAHCAQVERALRAYRERYLAAAAPFLARLRPAGLPATVVYPFGGGDLLSALTTYPDAVDVTTLSLEHAGDPRRLGAIATRRQLADSLRLIRETSAGLLYANDSRTENLMKGQRGEIPGQLAFFMLALAVHGYQPVSLRYFRVLPDGTLHYLTAAEIAAEEPRQAALLRKVWVAPDFSAAFSNAELTFARPGDPGPPRVHRHLAADLSDAALARTGLLRWLDGKGRVAAMTKAASYLLWRDDFSLVRSWLLGHMDLMISDSTGIPPRLARAAGFRQETWGRFERSFLRASAAINADFVALWASGPQRALPFRYGYLDGAEPVGHVHLLLTRPARGAALR
jgi:hypothetical protein